jgi:hypothetical protein
MFNIRWSLLSEQLSGLRNTALTMLNYQKAKPENMKDMDVISFYSYRVELIEKVRARIKSLPPGTPAEASFGDYLTTEEKMALEYWHGRALWKRTVPELYPRIVLPKSAVAHVVDEADKLAPMPMEGTVTTHTPTLAERIFQLVDDADKQELTLAQRLAAAGGS